MLLADSLNYGSDKTPHHTHRPHWLYTIDIFFGSFSFSLSPLYGMNVGCWILFIVITAKTWAKYIADALFRPILCPMRC